MRYDLHSHTTASDGSLSPSELVEHAKQAQVDCLAVTDHDITDGLDEARQAANRHGINFIPGIEVSVSWSHQTVHIVGLHIDQNDTSLQTGLKKILQFRQQRAEEISQRLSRAGIHGSYEGALRYAEGKIISRTHFARFLVEEGHAPDMRRVFKKFLIKNKPGYVPGQWAALEEAIGWIRNAKGIAVIAHPARYRFSATRLRQLLGEFKELGGEAIEVVSGSHSHQEVDHFARLADQFGFFASRGSDYHGPENAYASMDRLADLPDRCKPVWHSERWLQAKTA